MTEYRRVATLHSTGALREHLASLGVALPLDERLEAGGPLAEPFTTRDGFRIGNRFCIHPMEGWDGTTDGLPTDLTRRRWARFGQSGAKLIWGGEAVAVSPDGRANPNQLLMTRQNVAGIEQLRHDLVEAHAKAFGRTDDLLVGLQLTHSGRFARPHVKTQPEPVILYHHPVLDRRLGLGPDSPLLTDAEIERLIGCFVDAAEQAWKAGYAFVDVKHCHGYLGHEFLSARHRPGPYGGSFENRTRFLREIVAGIRVRVPDLRIGVRLSAFDVVPYHTSAEGHGIPESAALPYDAAFGVTPGSPTDPDLEDAAQFLGLLESLGVTLVNLTAGSPYYNPHIQRPALFPPSDGYGPPEDPLVGVARQLDATGALKRRFPGLTIVGSAYSYLQDWLPHVAQAVVRGGGADFVGLGRMVLSYPELPADVLAGRTLTRRRICRTFSDCTTAPRKGLVSGCYPLDTFYKERPEFDALAGFKKAAG